MPQAAHEGGRLPVAERCRSGSLGEEVQNKLSGTGLPLAPLLRFALGVKPGPKPTPVNKLKGAKKVPPGPVRRRQMKKQPPDVLPVDVR